MKRLLRGRQLARWGRLLPLLFVFQSMTCLPDDAFRQVFGENITFTAAIIIQTITSVVFNTIFGVA